AGETAEAIEGGADVGAEGGFLFFDVGLELGLAGDLARVVLAGGLPETIDEERAGAGVARKGGHLEGNGFARGVAAEVVAVDPGEDGPLPHAIVLELLIRRGGGETDALA